MATATAVGCVRLRGLRGAEGHRRDATATDRRTDGSAHGGAERGAELRRHLQRHPTELPTEVPVVSEAPATDVPAPTDGSATGEPGGGTLAPGPTPAASNAPVPAGSGDAGSLVVPIILGVILLASVLLFFVARRRRPPRDDLAQAASGTETSTTAASRARTSSAGARWRFTPLAPPPIETTGWSTIEASARTGQADVEPNGVIV